MTNSGSGSYEVEYGKIGSVIRMDAGSYTVVTTERIGQSEVQERRDLHNPVLGKRPALDTCRHGEQRLFEIRLSMPIKSMSPRF